MPGGLPGGGGMGGFGIDRHIMLISANSELYNCPKICRKQVQTNEKQQIQNGVQGQVKRGFQRKKTLI